MIDSFKEKAILKQIQSTNEEVLGVSGSYHILDGQKTFRICAKYQRGNGVAYVRFNLFDIANAAELTRKQIEVINSRIDKCSNSDIISSKLIYEQLLHKILYENKTSFSFFDYDFNDFIDLVILRKYPLIEDFLRDFDIIDLSQLLSKINFKEPIE